MRPHGWQVERFSDGVGFVLPGGRIHGGIRIREHRRPIAELSELVRRAANDLPLAGCDATPLESFVTAEGEYAVITTLAGTHEGVAIERTLAFVLGDEHYTQIDGLTAVAARFAELRAHVREVAYHHALGLGELRRRRFLYTPPAGWTTRTRGLVADHVSADATITVFPARALVESPIGDVERALREAEWAGFSGRATSTVAIETPHFRAGVVRTYAGSGRRIVVAVLLDDRFAYTCRLASVADEPAFHAMLSSIVPLPRPAPIVRTAELGGVVHWVD